MQPRCGDAVDTPPWWTVVQAVVWIITRSPRLVERASGIRTFAALERLQEFRPVAVGDDPPISPAAALAELNHAIKDARVGISGWRRGSGKRESVAMRGHLQTPRLWDSGNEVRLYNEPMMRAGDYWADLWVRSDECMNRWPAPAADAASSPSISAIAQLSPADGEQPENPAPKTEQKTETKHAPRKPGAKRFQIAAVRNYLNEQYPGSVPEEVSARSIEAALKAQGKAVSIRTIRRAMGGK